MKLENSHLIFKGNEKAYWIKNITNGENYSLENLFNVYLLNPAFILHSTDLEINHIEEDKESIKIQYAPFSLSQGQLKITCTLTLEDNKILGQLEMATENCSEETILDYLTFFPVETTVDKLIFTYPHEVKIKDDPYSFLETELLLGQPVYLKGFYFGSRFPANNNEAMIEKQNVIVHLEYYSGHCLTEFATKSFTSWDFVLGATKATDYEGMKTEFLEDIAKIAQVTPLRIQYNSWYDAFMSVTEEQFLTLAKEMNAFVEKYDLPQFDAYVLDDGWNNYNDETYTGIDVPRSGHSYNKSGFWEFNDKFPNEGYKINDYLKSIGSTFGIWLGPQGGYEIQDTFAQYLESVGTGSVNLQAALGKAIDVNDERYVQRLEKLFLDYQEKFNLTYWKLDGFASRPNIQDDHYHLVGGVHNRYYTTQLWERYIAIFEKMREVTPDIFLNLTCYVPVSPWFLQWSNTIWLQNSGDLEIAKDAPGSLADQIITGRDHIYLQKVFKEKLQFPLSHLYNHEPIYGNAVKTPMSDDEFEKYLLGNVFRGSLLWDMHLSPNLLTGRKTEILKKVLEFIRENEPILSNTQMISLGEAYGYYSVGDNTGYLYLRNPQDKEVPVDFETLPDVFQNAFLKDQTQLIYGNNPNDVSTLSPLEMKVWQMTF